MLDDPEFQSFFQTETLESRGREYHNTYVNNDPFPHIAIQNFFPETILDRVAASMDASETRWESKDSARSIKKSCTDETQMHPDIQALFYKLNSRPFLRFLEEMTGIEGLIPDPHLSGGGLHRIEQGGFLKVHADFNMQEKLRLDRRLNVLIYLNKNWQDEYGGHLELWDKPMKKCVQKIAPTFNCLAAFSTTDTSWHGHPDPLRSPKGLARQSLALYYYTNGRPENEKTQSHGTLYQKRPDEQFKTNLGDKLKRSIRKRLNRV